jgi:hypothetical protein
MVSVGLPHFKDLADKVYNRHAHIALYYLPKQKTFDDVGEN